jgi:hypothetical protein
MFTIFIIFTITIKTNRIKTYICWKILKNNDLVEFVEDSEEFYKKISKNVKILRQKYKYTQLDFSANIGFNSVSFY